MTYGQILENIQMKKELQTPCLCHIAYNLNRATLTHCGFVLQGLLSVVHVPGETVRCHLDWVFLSLFPEKSKQKTTVITCRMHSAVRLWTLSQIYSVKTSALCNLSMFDSAWNRESRLLFQVKNWIVFQGSYSAFRWACLSNRSLGFSHWETSVLQL